MLAVQLPNCPITRLPNHQIHGSIVASSISMTGMSSLMGYTRLHVAHLSAVPFLTSVTGVLQLGQARISSSSGSTGMAWNYMTALRFCGTIISYVFCYLSRALARCACGRTDSEGTP